MMVGGHSFRCESM